MTLRATARGTVALLLGVLCLCTPAFGAEDEGVHLLQGYWDILPRYSLQTLQAGSLRVRPETEMDLGFTRLHAFAGVGLLFDSNIYLTDRDEESDLILTVPLGGRAESVVGDHLISLNYMPTRLNYRTNTENSTWNHLADLAIRLNYPDAYVQLSDHFSQLQTVIDIQLGGLVDQRNHTPRLEAGYRWVDFGAGVYYEHRDISYGGDVPEFQDYREGVAGLFAWWGASPDHSWQAEYRYQRRTWRQDVYNNSVTNSLLVGIDGSHGPDLSYRLKVGVAWILADDNGIIDDDSDLLDLVLEAELSAFLTPELSTTVFYVQRPEPAFGSNWSKRHLGGLRAMWELQPDAIFLRGGAYLERTSFSNQSSLTLAGFRIGADFNFTRHLGAGLGYEYRQRIGEGFLDYSVQQLYLQAVVYF